MQRGGYRHTQPGWVIVAAFVGTALVLGVVLVALGMPAAAVASVLFVGALGTAFGSLTVTVGGDELRFWFGPGVLRKSLPLRDIRTFRRVRNSWAHGWGIRLYGGGVLYNVSGLDAVEVVLTDGRQLRIGTDEPDRLLEALRAAVGDPAPLDATETANVSRRAARWMLLVGAIVLTVLLGIGGMLYGESRPPRASVDAEGLHVASLVYSTTMPLSGAQSVELTEALPRILLRTNGTGLGSTVRGHFRVEGWGDGHLFAELDSPPFLVVRGPDDFVVVSYADANRTRTLHAAVMQARASAATPHR